jgi:hypothetical protein
MAKQHTDHRASASGTSGGARFDLPSIEDFQKLAREAEELLESQCVGSGAEEKLLSRLAAHEVAFAQLVGTAQVLLARKLRDVGDARSALQLAKVLREVTAVRNTVTRRGQELLTAAAALGAQRRLTGVLERRSLA